MRDKAKAIIFNIQMVQAILEGRKTQDRRVVMPQPAISQDGIWNWKDCQWADGGLGFPVSGIIDHAKYHPGDILWAQETWAFVNGYDYGTDNFYVYKASNEWQPGYFAEQLIDRWRSPVCMPREAARIFLRVTDVRVERLQDISEKDAKAEGIRSYWLTKEAGKNADDWHESSGPPFIGAAKEIGADLCSTRREAYQQLWDSLNAKSGHGWDNNPWVWVSTFERVADNLTPADRQGAQWRIRTY